MPFFLQIRQEPENANHSYQLKPKGGRRRWGHSTGLFKGEDWDDYDTTELTSLSILGKADFSTEKFWQGEGSLSR